jgi:hypothetical protein
VAWAKARDLEHRCSAINNRFIVHRHDDVFDSHASPFSGPAGC